MNDILIPSLWKMKVWSHSKVTTHDLMPLMPVVQMMQHKLHARGVYILLSVSVSDSNGAVIFSEHQWRHLMLNSLCVKWVKEWQEKNRVKHDTFCFLTQRKIISECSNGSCRKWLRLIMISISLHICSDEWFETLFSVTYLCFHSTLIQAEEKLHFILIKTSLNKGKLSDNISRFLIISRCFKRTFCVFCWLSWVKCKCVSSKRFLRLIESEDVFMPNIFGLLQHQLFGS